MPWVEAAQFDATVSACGIVTRLITFAFLQHLGLAHAMQTITGHNYGAGPFHRSDQSLRTAATVRSSEQLRPGQFRLVLDLDKAVDVVRFESFSNLRKQIRVEVGPAGHSKERTSDRRPHVELDP